MSAEPLVTVVIPCWNAADSVGESVESAFAQSYDRIEVVVIDDGSTDGSQGVLRSFGNRIRVEYGPNRGGASARNRGVDIAEGDLVQFLDADDLLTAGKIERQVRHLGSLGESVMSFCTGTVEGDEPFLASQYGRIFPEDSDPVCFLLPGILATPAPLHRRKTLIEAGGFDAGLPCAQEYDLHLRLVCGGAGLSQVQEAGFHVRRRSGSVSSDGNRVLRQMGRILGRARGILLEREAMNESRARCMAGVLGRAATTLEADGETEEAGLLWVDARELWPGVEAGVWPPRWRPLVRLFGSARTSRLRRRLLRAAGRGR